MSITIEVLICSLSLQVKRHAELSQQNQAMIVPIIARVLAWSQWYMRNRKVHDWIHVAIFVNWPMLLPLIG